MLSGVHPNVSQTIVHMGLDLTGIETHRSMRDASARLAVKLVKNGAGLKCDTCNRVYPIKDDIPVMLIDEATIEP